MSKDKSPRSPAPRAGRQFHQCLECGAPVEPKFGAGELSWCPGCCAEGSVRVQTGHFPDPILYGLWLCEQSAAAPSAEAPPAVPASRNSGTPISPAFSAPDFQPTPPRKGLLMRTPKLHTGIFHCPDCAIDFDLIGEECLLCDRCNGLLEKGCLADRPYETDDEEP